MHYSVIKDYDIADGPGVRVSLFVSGCTNHCKNCFQPQTWDFCFGQEFTSETEDLILSYLDKPYVRGLTLLGGEPMEPENQRGLLPLVRRVRKELPTKDIWCYSGNTLEEILDEKGHSHCEVTSEFLSLIDVLVDGRFVEELKDPGLWFKGSSNQRVINLKRTLETGSVVIVERPQRF